MAATHHRYGSHTLPRRPCAHADPTTPAGENGLLGRLLPRPPTAFPLWKEGRLQRETIEACSGFTCLSACALAPWLHQGFPRRLQWAITRLNCSSGYRGVSTIPRAGLSPAGLRDPEGLTVNSTSQLTSDLLSCRTSTLIQRHPVVGGSISSPKRSRRPRGAKPTLIWVDRREEKPVSKSGDRHRRAAISRPGHSFSVGNRRSLREDWE
jgi:hypothetical protein